MNVSDLRKGILRALEDARKDGVERRREKDEASAAFELFLESIAIPLFRQAADVLKAEKHEFTMQSPSGLVRLVSDRSSQDLLELELDTTGAKAQVMGRLSLYRGRRNPVVEERPIAPSKKIADLSEDDVARFLMSEIPKLVAKP